MKKEPSGRLFEVRAVILSHSPEEPVSAKYTWSVSAIGSSPAKTSPGSTRPLALDDSYGSRKENPNVRPEGTRPCISKIDPDHIIERGPAPTGYLPQAGYPRFGCH